MSFKNIQKQLNDITDKYGDKLDIAELLDSSELLKDNPMAIFDEIARQPAIYAYLCNMRRIADDNYELLVDKFERFKSSKISYVIDCLKSDSILKPTIKVIESSFHNIMKSNEFYKTITPKIAISKKRKEIMAIVVKSFEIREQSFRSLSYLMDTMIRTGMIHPDPSKRKRIE